MHPETISPSQTPATPEPTDAPRRPMPAATGAPTNEAPPQVQAILDACSHGATPGRGGWILRRRTTSPLETRFITR